MSGADRIFAAARETGLAREGHVDSQQAQFEARVIKQLLRYARIELNVRAAKQQSWEATQAVNINFAWFHERYPRFPIYLGSAKLKNTAGTHIPWTALFGAGFMKLPWMADYEKLCATMNWDVHKDRVALCFNVPHAPGASIMVLHNQPIQVDNSQMVLPDQERRTETETRILRPLGRDRIVYVLESLNSFLTTVGTDWAHD
jgi:hypothetical protein